MAKNGAMPILAGLGFATIFGFSFLFTLVALDYVDIFRLLAFRFSLGAFAVTALVAMGVAKVSLAGKSLAPLLSIALLQPISYFLFETFGLELTSSSEAGMMIALIPVLVAILGAIFLAERTTPLQWGFIALSIAGVSLIALFRGQGETAGNIVGPLLLFGAVLSAAVFNILSRRSSRGYTPVEMTFAMMWIGAIAFNAIALVYGWQNGTLATYFEPLRHGPVWIGLLYLGLLSSVVAFFLVNYALSTLPASQASIFANFVTVVAVFAGVFFRAEPFYWYSAFGSAMILTGVWGTNYFGQQNRTRPTDDKNGGRKSTTQ